MIAVTRIGGARGSDAVAAAAAAALGREDGGLLVEVGTGRPRRPAALASAGARRLELLLAERVEGATPVARGAFCHLHAGAGPEGLELAAAAARECGDAPLVMHVAPEQFRAAIEDGRLSWRAALLRAEMPAARGVAALAVPDLLRRGILVKVVKRPLGWVAARRALAGLPEESSRSLTARLASERGQALPAMLGAAAIVLIAALALVSIAGALSGKSRLQRAADLAALSAARSLRDDLPRLLSPPVLADGRPNPRHLDKQEYLSRARAAGRVASRANGVGSERVRITFPDAGSFAPLRARARITADVEASGRTVARTAASALAEAAPPSAPAGPPGRAAFASGGGYSGPLAYRQGEDMRPDVAAAFDRMSAAATADGVALVISSGFRSDAEQAVLFAANPDPRWVAPPGRSLHRCATELDLGPPQAYAWLAANAHRFGFVQRYSWEPWHYGFDAGPTPCSAAGNAVSGSGSDGRSGGEAGLPGYVPAPYRDPLLRAAGRWGVSAAVLAAQLMAESNFNPYAVSPAGAQGIAQFIPSTAAAYGLTDPFDAEAAIDAQAHLMSDLLRQFGAVPLALAAYNAGPAPVAACSCVPAIPETTAYVARILGLLEGSGALLLSPPLEVRLIE